MRAFLQDDWRERWSFLSMLHCGLVISGLALPRPPSRPAEAGMVGAAEEGGGSAADASRAMEAMAGLAAALTR
jgi:hypothetical protein